MEYTKEKSYNIEHKKRTSKIFLKTIIALTFLFSAVNVFGIYSFYKILMNI